MDLLGSILGKMDAPPSTPVDEETKKKVKEAREKAQKFKEEERKRKSQFREKIEERINKFLQGPTNEKKLVLETMDKLHRSIARYYLRVYNRLRSEGSSLKIGRTARHEVAETAGLASYSFGEEGVDRHLIGWKKEFAPCEEELEAIKNGEEYDPERAKLAAEERQRIKAEQAAEERLVLRKRRIKTTEQDKYFEKYAKIVGEDSGLDAAQLTKTNKSYGMVPSKNKEDKRSIEEVMKEIRERKKTKHPSET